jgi:hypothetical protein
MTEDPTILKRKIPELRGFAKEYRNYSRTMPTDPFALRWALIAEAFEYQADGYERALAAIETEAEADAETGAP